MSINLPVYGQFHITTPLIVVSHLTDAADLREIERNTFLVLDNNDRPQSWRRPPHRPLCHAQAPQHRRKGTLEDHAVMPSGPKGPLPYALLCGLPRRMTTRSPGRTIHMSILVIYDNLAKHVGILGQLCEEGENFSKVNPGLFFLRSYYSSVTTTC